NIFVRHHVLKCLEEVKVLKKKEQSDCVKEADDTEVELQKCEKESEEIFKRCYEDIKEEHKKRHKDELKEYEAKNSSPYKTSTAKKARIALIDYAFALHQQRSNVLSKQVRSVVVSPDKESHYCRDSRMAQIKEHQDISLFNLFCDEFCQQKKNSVPFLCFRFEDRPNDRSLVKIERKSSTKFNVFLKQEIQHSETIICTYCFDYKVFYRGNNTFGAFIALTRKQFETICDQKNNCSIEIRQEFDTATKRSRKYDMKIFVWPIRKPRNRFGSKDQPFGYEDRSVYLNNCWCLLNATGSRFFSKTIEDVKMPPEVNFDAKFEECRKSIAPSWRTKELRNIKALLKYSRLNLDNTKFQSLIKTLQNQRDSHVSSFKKYRKKDERQTDSKSLMNSLDTVIKYLQKREKEDSSPIKDVPKKIILDLPEAPPISCCLTTRKSVPTFGEDSIKICLPPVVATEWGNDIPQSLRYKKITMYPSNITFALVRFPVRSSQISKYNIQCDRLDDTHMPSEMVAANSMIEIERGTMVSDHFIICVKLLDKGESVPRPMKFCITCRLTAKITDEKSTTILIYLTGIVLPNLSRVTSTGNKLKLLRDKKQESLFILRDSFSPTDRISFQSSYFHAIPAKYRKTMTSKGGKQGEKCFAKEFMMDSTHYFYKISNAKTKDGFRELLNNNTAQIYWDGNWTDRFIDGSLCYPSLPKIRMVMAPISSIDGFYSIYKKPATRREDSYLWKKTGYIYLEKEEYENMRFSMIFIGSKESVREIYKHDIRDINVTFSDFKATHTFILDSEEKISFNQESKINRIKVVFNDNSNIPSLLFVQFQIPLLYEEKNYPFSAKCNVSIPNSQSYSFDMNICLDQDRSLQCENNQHTTNLRRDEEETVNQFYRRRRAILHSCSTILTRVKKQHECIGSGDAFALKNGQLIEKVEFDKEMNAVKSVMKSHQSFEISRYSTEEDSSSLESLTTLQHIIANCRESLKHFTTSSFIECVEKLESVYSQIRKHLIIFQGKRKETTTSIQVQVDTYKRDLSNRCKECSAVIREISINYSIPPSLGRYNGILDRISNFLSSKHEKENRTVITVSYSFINPSFLRGTSSSNDSIQPDTSSSKDPSSQTLVPESHQTATISDVSTESTERKQYHHRRRLLMHDDEDFETI
ncbi:hypothetical protein ADUPG1_010568, partial [Aduncisulcus paluster]